MKFIGIIPARYASTRFPGKPLVLLGGKPVVQWVYEQAKKVLDEVCVATDHKEIFRTVEAFGGKAVMTSESHRSGTDRCYEAYSQIGTGGEVVINIQGDEPFVHRSQLETLMKCFDDSQTEIATLVKPFSAEDNIESLKNPNSPKVVLDRASFALYFSRSVIPYLRDVPKEEWLKHGVFYKHIGIYAYTAEALKQITSLPQSALEKSESLEQLRWLENGLRIKTGISHLETIGIDTEEDLKRAELFLNEHGNR